MLNEAMETPMRRPQYHPTAADRAVTAQWTRGVLAVYGVIAMTFVIGVAANHTISSASAARTVTLQPAEVLVSETTSATPGVTSEPGQQPATFQTASDAGTQETLAENAWDFNRPETIPGFGPMTPTAPRHAQQERKPETATATQPQERPTVDIRALLEDPAMRTQPGLVENHWDFNKPDTIPGFGSMPPADEPRRVAKNADEAAPSATAR
jgi:hypothetical protein